MIEFLVRLTYLIIVLCLYYLGVYFSPPRGVSRESLLDFKLILSLLDFKLILPIISLVFLEYFIRRFSPFYHKIKIKNIRFETDGMFIEFLLQHWGLEPCNYSYGKLSGVKSDALSLQFRLSDNTLSPVYVPETYATTLSRDKNMVTIILNSSPGNPLRKIMIFGKKKYYMATLWIKVNDFPVLHLFLVKKNKEI